MIKNIILFNQNLNKLLTSDQKKDLNTFKLISFINALVELIGISVIVPFIFCILNVEKIFNYPIIITISNLFGISNEFNFLLTLGVICIIVTFLIGIISFYANFKSIEFSQKLSINFKSRLFKYYIDKNYFYHLTKNSNELINNFLGETARISEGIILPLITLQLKLIIISLIFFSLFFIEPMPTILIFSSITFFYLIVYKNISRKIRSLGLKTKIYNDQISKYAYPSINDIKNTKIYGLEEVYYKYIKYFFKKDSNIKVIINSLTLVPKQIIDFLLIFGAVTALLIFLKIYGKIDNLLPILGAYIYAAAKIIPQANNIYASFSSIKNNLPAYDNIFLDLENSLIEHKNNIKKFSLKKNITLKNISFGYPGRKKDQKRKDVITNLNIKISNDSHIGIFGKSGSGKSTLADIISGLIKPESGSIFFDGIEIKSESDYYNYRKQVCYISQAPFLMNETLEKNIAFLEKDPDYLKLKDAADLSCCSDFINSLPNKFKTQVTDRLNFSGGQSQRISLARAFYLDKPITIFDECTSSLDSETEQKVVKNIFDYFKSKTLIFISHRIKNLDKCNEIYEFTSEGLIKK